MTVKDIIDKVDELMPSQYSEDIKIAWLSQLDGKIYLEEIVTHTDPLVNEMPEYTAETDELMIDYPYGEDIYIYHLESMICAQNAETSRYNMYVTLFNAAYERWETFYNRTHAYAVTNRVRF